MQNIIKSIFVFFFLSLFLTSFCFASNGVQVPETFEEARDVGERALETTTEELPEILERIWEESVLPVWESMYDWFSENIWSKVKDFFGSRIEDEIEIRKEIVDQEFEMEKEEAKEELPGILDKIWKFIRDVAHKLKILWK